MPPGKKENQEGKEEKSEQVPPVKVEKYTTCSIARDRVNSSLVRQWIGAGLAAGRPEDLGANKRTLQRLVGGKKKRENTRQE